MDRPQHRRTLLVALVLLAGAALLFLGRQWKSEPERLVAEAELPQQQAPEPQASNIAPARGAADTNAPAPPATTAAAPATGFRGRVIDAVTRLPLPEFEVRLIPIRHEGMGTSYLEPITKTFQSKSGRFVWSDLDAGTWVAGVCAPGHQMFNVPEFTIEAGKAKRSSEREDESPPTVRNLGSGKSGVWVTYVLKVGVSASACFRIAVVVSVTSTVT